ncbi:MAG TPA: metallophosphoesterase [Bacteroidetes bacterium]|nr:metallophosphoesterase [Bacteroidota bacterium]
MNQWRFILFFSIVLSLYGLLNFYIFVHGWGVVQGSLLEEPYLVLFLVFSLSFVGGRFLERVRLSWLSSLLVWVGAFWLAAMVYFLLAVLAIDLIRLVNYLVPIIPDGLSKEVVAAVVCSVVVGIVVLGHVNALTPRIKVLEFTIPKNGHRLQTLDIAVASDIHLGTIVCKARLERIVAKINELKPDLVLLPGDVIDEDIGPVIKQNLGETLRKIQARYGVVAITGNHEYIGGVDAACKYLVEHGVSVLRDSSVKIEDSVYIVGREDRAIGQFARRKRKSLDELMASVDVSCPVILMDHQPFKLDEAERCKVDLQLSGHTHHGQLWPFNFITRSIYEVSWGYTKKGSTHIYVSSGVGTWGPPVRTGNRPEIVHLKLRFA